MFERIFRGWGHTKAAQPANPSPRRPWPFDRTQVSIDYSEGGAGDRWGDFEDSLAGGFGAFNFGDQTYLWSVPNAADGGVWYTELHNPPNNLRGQSYLDSNGTDASFGGDVPLDFQERIFSNPPWAR